MRKFLQKAFLAVLLVIFVLVSFWSIFLVYVAPQYSLSYQASILDKIERLKSINEPKIILVGHSNLAFGIDSAMIEEAMGMPVVNMGLHGGLGNEFHENMAKYNINKGDIIVCCHSSYGNDRSKIGDYSLAWITLENHFDLWKLVSLDEWSNMISSFPEYIESAIELYLSENGNRDSNNIYSRNAFNPYGDIAWERTESIYTWTKGSISVPLVEEDAVNDVNELYAFSKERGATVVIAGYPVGDGEYTPDHDLFIEAWKTLKQSVECPVISDIEDYFFDYSLFYDTHLHLTTEGTYIRTSQLIEDLITWKSAIESN